MPNFKTPYNICPACHANLTQDCFFLDEANKPDYWICKECKSDRIGCHYVIIDGFDPFEIHASCKGLKDYKGINLDTWGKFISVYAQLRGELLN